LQSLSAAAAHELAHLAREANIERGNFSVALSGGNTPRSLYETLAKDYQSAIDWKHVHLFWGDERFVPHDDPASNYRMAKETLIELIPIPPENVHPIDISSDDPGKTAADYSDTLLSTIGGPIPSFDLILLGLGADGHTASLFPGMDFDSLNGKLVVVTSSPVPPKVRISLTIDVINAARNIFFLAVGREKARILHEVLDDRGNAHSQFPASMIKPVGNLFWFVDEAANGVD
jgi:6-phosphogluconolactonase